MTLQYLPVDLEDGTRAGRSRGARAGTPHNWLYPESCRHAIGEPVEYQPASWLPDVQQAWWYQISSFAYCIVGTATFVRPEPLLACAPHFPFCTMGFGIVVNGILSYMGDVYTWGVWSRWKAADIILATTNTLLQFLLVAMGICGYAAFPPEAPALLALSLAIALFCKARGTAAVARGDCARFLLYHSLWHYTLPLGAGISSQLLLEMPRLHGSEVPR